MAIWHLRAQVISRSKGRSSVAAAAYRSAERLIDYRTGLVHDFTGRTRHEVEAWIQSPEDAPAWARDRQELWRAVEDRERRKNSQTAREVEVALPVELGRDKQRELVRGWVREQWTGRGVVADVAIHRDPEGRNPHAHVLFATREIGPEGFGVKVREPDRRAELERWREGWERRANRELERAGVRARIDRRSYAERGIDREPTVHEGPYVRELEARGHRTDRGGENRLIRQRNAEREREAERERRREAERERDFTQGRER